MSGLQDKAARPGILPSTHLSLTLSLTLSSPNDTVDTGEDKSQTFKVVRFAISRTHVLYFLSPNQLPFTTCRKLERSAAATCGRNLGCCARL